MSLKTPKTHIFIGVGLQKKKEGMKGVCLLGWEQKQKFGPINL